MTTTTATSKRIATLQTKFLANELSKADVVALAKTEGLTLPADFFAATSTNAVATELKAPSTFPADQGAGATGGARQAELRMQASKPAPGRTLPNPAPTKVRIGHMNLKLLGQDKDMCVYMFRI